LFDIAKQNGILKDLVLVYQDDIIWWMLFYLNGKISTPTDAIAVALAS
jgi:hypothetical protein